MGVFLAGPILERLNQCTIGSGSDAQIILEILVPLVYRPSLKVHFFAIVKQFKGFCGRAWLYKLTLAVSMQMESNKMSQSLWDPLNTIYLKRWSEKPPYWNRDPRHHVYWTVSGILRYDCILEIRKLSVWVCLLHDKVTAKLQAQISVRWWYQGSCS